jgi:hypothetical protein
MKTFTCLQIDSDLYQQEYIDMLVGRYGANHAANLLKGDKFRPAWQFAFYADDLEDDVALEECFAGGNYQPVNIRCDIKKLHERATSISVGNVVRHEESGKVWLCASVGWEMLP